MRGRVRAAVVVLIAGHAVVHLLGTRLTAGAAAPWLAGAVLLGATGVLLAVRGAGGGWSAQWRWRCHKG